MKVEIPGTTLERDTNSKALVEKDQTKVDDYRSRRRAMKAAKDNTERINMLEQDIAEIKALLRALIAGNTN
jgi:hypothetical protein